MVVGICVGETSLSEVTFISDKMPKVGEYVTIEYDGKKVLGMIENLIRGNDALNVDINDFKAIRKISQIGAEDNYIRGKVKILGDVNDNLKLPRTPVLPGTEIKLADRDTLNEIFKVNNPIKLGCLVNQSDVDVNVEANPILSRHLAILAMTGAGKSNTVSVLINEMLSYFVPVFVFDMHGEYVGANFPNGEVNVIKPKINPVYMSFHEIKRLVNIPSNGYIQERHFRRAFKTAKEMVRSGTAHTNNFLQIIYDILLSDSQEEGSDKQIVDVMNKIDDSMDKYANIFDNNIGNILTNIKIGHVNVLDLSQSDESIANVLVSHIMRNALQMRKNAVHGKDERALDFPVFFILEEAHILAPNKRDSDSKRWIQRVAREGRKFGLGLCLVSQSPKTVDHDALSQMNNMIILRLVEPEDQRHVQSASESLSQDLVNQLPSLNVGEAVVLGLMSKVPTLVKIDEFKGRLHGDDMDIVSYFADIRQKEQEEIEELEKESMEMGYNY
ncbi:MULTISPECIES: helicase HerA-like domain-containing protein [unclassified Methanobrevibacter]|uniref:helicase HerA-like domain-containing protein n=1 Tax=unclassified Methanobrevibacter TaxID=2638681 RepID=UPI0025CEA133|nr:MULTISPECIES: ATP-binding protein [unclassified Methanobrevibacter]MEE0942871.1 ATP-binding protein [Methanobrevibacter sp.]